MFATPVSLSMVELYHVILIRYYTIENYFASILYYPSKRHARPSKQAPCPSIQAEAIDLASAWMDCPLASSGVSTQNIAAASGKIFIRSVEDEQA